MSITIHDTYGLCEIYGATQMHLCVGLAREPNLRIDASRAFKQTEILSWRPLLLEIHSVVEKDLNRKYCRGIRINK